jgi:hypothetical protein
MEIYDDEQPCFTFIENRKLVALLTTRKGESVMKQRIAPAIGMGLIMALGMIHTADATLIVADDFLVTDDGQPDNYDRGDLYKQSPTRTGFDADSGWGENHSQTENAFSVDSASGMSWSGNSATYAIDGSGGALARGGAIAAFTERYFDTGVGDGNEFWGRFLWDPQGESGAFSQEITFNVNGRGRVGSQNANDIDQFAIRIGSTANQAQIFAYNESAEGNGGSLVSLSANTTHYVLFQVLVDRTTDGAETLRMWINPDNISNIRDGIADSAATLDFMGSGDSLSNLYVRMATANQGMIDELVMGDSMYDVGVIPEPSTLVLVGLAFLSLAVFRKGRG